MKKAAPQHSQKQPRKCIVCNALAAISFASVKGQYYWRCATCQATFLDPAQRLSAADEHARYQTHQNDPMDKGYRQFLLKLLEPLLQRLQPKAMGLDYGCGPGPALALMLREAGHQVQLFDPFFVPDPKPLENTYDFITCTETLEHFYHPAEEFARFDQMLRPGGWLALMTRFLLDDSLFASWHYRRDSTHVVFFTEATLRHVADSLGWSCEIPIKDVALMQKPNL